MRVTIASLQEEIAFLKDLVKNLRDERLNLLVKLEAQETIINHFKSNVGTQSCMIIGMERLGDAMAHVITDLKRGQR